MEGEMEKQAHTPGPWSLMYAIIGSVDPQKHPSHIVASPSGSADSICDFDWMTKRPLLEQQANAAIICAAPDMFSALSEIADRHIPDQPSACGLDEIEYVKKQYAELRAIAWRALSKLQEAR